MTEKDLINSYKKRLAESTEKAPEDLWAKIDRNLDIEEVWDKIDRKLDIDQVWDNINSQLEYDKSKKRKVFWLLTLQAASIAGIIVITGLALSDFLNLNHDDKMLATTRQNVVITNNDTIQQNNIPSLPYPPVTDEDKPIQLEYAGVDHTMSPAMPDLAEEITLARFENRQIPVEAEISDESLIAQLPARVLLPNHKTLTVVNDDHISEYDLATLLLEEDNGQLHRNFLFIPNPYGLSLGLTSAIKNTWLMNTETALALEGINGSSTRLNFFTDFSLTIRYNLTPRWGVKGNVSLYSNTGQSYQQFIYGRYSNRDIKLNYAHFDLAATYRHKNSLHSFSNLLGHTSSLGFYIASLNHANETIADRTQDVSHVYNNTDWGLVVGHAVDIKLHPNFLISPGVLANLGLTNIYSGQNNIVSPVNRTFNFSFDFRVTLYYNLGGAR